MILWNVDLGKVVVGSWKVVSFGIIPSSKVTSVWDDVGGVCCGHEERLRGKSMSGGYGKALMDWYFKPNGFIRSLCSGNRRFHFKNGHQMCSLNWTGIDEDMVQLRLHSLDWNFEAVWDGNYWCSAGLMFAEEFDYLLGEREDDLGYEDLMRCDVWDKCVFVEHLED